MGDPLHPGHQIPVGRGHGPGLGHQQLHVGVVHVEGDDAGAPGTDDLEGHVDGVAPPVRGHVAEQAPLDGRVRAETAELDAVRTAAPGQVVHHGLTDAGHVGGAGHAGVQGVAAAGLWVLGTHYLPTAQGTIAG